MGKETAPVSACPILGKGERWELVLELYFRTLEVLRPPGSGGGGWEALGEIASSTGHWTEHRL
jgi:hypothetical protein